MLLMSLLIDKQKFDQLNDDDKKLRLSNYLNKKLLIAKLNDDDVLVKQYSLLLNLQPEISKGFGKFMIIDTKEGKFIEYCNDITSALHIVYEKNNKITPFIYQIPLSV